MASLWTGIFFQCLSWNLICRSDGAIVCIPNSYTITAGIRSTVSDVFATLSCSTTSAATLTYSIDESKDGYSYFKMDGSSLMLAHRIDVEDGLNTWPVEIIVSDGNSPDVIVPVTVNTFTSTTTTTTTPPPPGYNWFESDNNTILFGVTMGTIALTTSLCVVLCFRFHRKGTCLPKSCPEYNKCLASFRRQVTCCPLPTGGAKRKPEEPDDEVDDTVYEEVFPAGPKPDEQPKKAKQKVIDDIERGLPAVSPMLITNAKLRDAGFDGMREPGFNAPINTSYGGKQRTISRVSAKKF
ncbi:uncharacterized protein LOC127858351 [Dreissena polymorpha]|uniref:Cadherin domain-containing protein n=1 Tax=Dreissena polymorpha TaxID=45954 RepID=A0A9D3Z0X4_DREPO|nr:uncharacterized protein LOC127858351 [Dreissena polymorpha]KAH3709867.1 hypothetical protein DPMN_069332 [Dreissena polymorpha]